MKKTIIVLLVIIGAFVAGCVYYFIDPSTSVWVPKCPFKLLTGYDCPACGNQRALHAFVHGNFSDAFHYNPFVIISMPYILLLLISWGGKTGTLAKIKSIVQHPTVVYVYVVLICCWWVLRNIFWR